MPTFEGRVLDRVERWDDRNLAHPVSLAAPELTEGATPPKSKSRHRQTWLDQGDEGGCTGFSLATALSFAPGGSKKVDGANADYFYWQAKLNDEFPGENYEGSSVLGANKAAKANGYLTSYAWATSIGDICAAIAFVGPVIFGINWYDTMFHPDANNTLKIPSGARLAGGHAICASSYKDNGSLILLDNTWGSNWGSSGSAWIEAESVERLLRESGECCVPVKAHPLPKPMGTHARVDPSNNGGVVNPS